LSIALFLFWFPARAEVGGGRTLATQQDGYGTLASNTPEGPRESGAARTKIVSDNERLSKAGGRKYRGMGGWRGGWGTGVWYWVSGTYCAAHPLTAVTATGAQ